VGDREAAARLTGTGLYVDRADLPPPAEDEFYLADLVGLRAETAAGEALGRVRSVEEHGAGAFLVLDGPPERLVPFTRACVPVVDTAAGRVVVEPPEETAAPPPPDEAAA
jgi:16S rRNA processing protein RimM